VKRGEVKKREFANALVNGSFDRLLLRLNMELLGNRRTLAGI
jgi:hypothetical protein